MMFDKNKTVYAEAINFTIDMFEKQHDSSNTAKLMIILSDGNGMYVEKQRVTSAVARARMQNIFLLFIIVENPTKKVTFHFPFTITFTYDDTL